MNWKCRFHIWVRKWRLKLEQEQYINAQKREYMDRIISTLAEYGVVNFHYRYLGQSERDAFLLAVKQLGLEKDLTHCKKEKRYTILIKNNE